MFVVNNDLSIFLTRGDIATIDVGATTSEGQSYVFVSGDKIRLRVFEKNRCNNVVLEKTITVSEETTVVSISLDSDDTRFGEVISKPKDYWYEIELNPDTRPQTIIGYDSVGPKIFRLYPEGGDI